MGRLSMTITCESLLLKGGETIMQRQVPTWLAVVIILAVIVVVGVVYWLLMPKPSSGVGGQVTATAIPSQPLQR